MAKTHYSPFSPSDGHYPPGERLGLNVTRFEGRLLRRCDGRTVVQLTRSAEGPSDGDEGFVEERSSMCGAVVVTASARNRALSSKIISKIDYVRYQHLVLHKTVLYR